MTYRRMVLEIGMGTDIRGADYTKAAVRALRDALWHNSLNVADALGVPTDSMVVEVLIGVPRPERVDKAQVLAVLPHGTGTVTVVEGGLEIYNDAKTSSTVIANAAAIVRLGIYLVVCASVIALLLWCLLIFSGFIVAALIKPHCFTLY